MKNLNLMNLKAMKIFFDMAKKERLVKRGQYYFALSSYEEGGKTTDFYRVFSNNRIVKRTPIGGLQSPECVEFWSFQENNEIILALEDMLRNQ